METVGQVIGILIVIVVLVPALIWTVAWTVGIIAGSAHVVKNVKEHLESQGTPKPLAWPLAVVAAIGFAIVMCWLIGQGRYYN